MNYYANKMIEVYDQYANESNKIKMAHASDKYIEGYKMAIAAYRSIINQASSIAVLEDKADDLEFTLTRVFMKIEYTVEEADFIYPNDFRGMTMSEAYEFYDGASDASLPIFKMIADFIGKEE